MSAAMKKNFKTAAILAAFAFVAGALLVGVRALTYVPYSFSMTAADSLAISSLTTSTRFGVIDHSAIKETNGVRVVLRIEDGADKDKYLIRGYDEGFEKALVETYTLISHIDGTIEDIAICVVESGNTYYIDDVKPHLATLFGNMIGRTSLGAFNKSTDGVAGATFTSTALYNSVGNAINYYKANASAIKAATPTKTVGAPQADPILADLRTLFADATDYTEIGSFTASDYKLSVYVTNDFGVACIYSATALEEEYKVLYSIDSDGGAIIGEPSVLGEVDGALVAAATEIVTNHFTEITGSTRIRSAFGLDDNKYGAFGRGVVVYDGGGSYSVTVAMVVSTDSEIKAKPLCVAAITDAGNGFSYMEWAIDGAETDGVAGATKSYGVVQSLIGFAESLIAGLVA